MKAITFAVLPMVSVAFLPTLRLPSGVVRSGLTSRRLTMMAAGNDKVRQDCMCSQPHDDANDLCHPPPCTQDALNKYSRTITQPKSQGASQAMLYATGLEPEDMAKAQVLCFVDVDGMMILSQLAIYLYSFSSPSVI